MVFALITNEELGLPKNATAEDRAAVILKAHQQVMRVQSGDRSKGLHTDFSEAACRLRAAHIFCGLRRMTGPR
jgi:hypothetical protein